MSAERRAGNGVTIAPWLTVADASGAVRFYVEAFGAVETYRLDGDDGEVVAARLELDGAPLWVQQEEAPSPGSRDHVRMIVTVDDPDARFDRAVSAGATPVSPVAEEHGWRTGRIRDPFGFDWEFGEQLDA
jgi:PhnB protein